jgi:hypothetical protein
LAPEGPPTIAQGVRTFCICVVSALRARLAGAIDSGIIAAFPSPSRRLVVGSGSDGKPSAWEMCGSTQMSDAQGSTPVKSAICARNAKCSHASGWCVACINPTRKALGKQPPPHDLLSPQQGATERRAHHASVVPPGLNHRKLPPDTQGLRPGLLSRAPLRGLPRH